MTTLKHTNMDFVIGEATGSDIEATADAAVQQASSNFVGEVADHYGMSKFQVDEHFHIETQLLALIGEGDDEEHKATAIVAGRATLIELN